MTIANDPQHIREMARDADVRRAALELMTQTLKYRYTYNFSWMDRPIIQFPADVVAMQEIIWSVKPDVVIETGIAHGGSLVLSASILKLLGGDRRVIGVDIDIRAANRAALDAHPMRPLIDFVEGSSTDPATIARVAELAAGRERVVVVLDSMHTHDHVLRELELYSPFVRPGGYIIVFDTIIEDLPADAFPDRPWGPGNSPKTAVHEFLGRTDRFVIDKNLEDRLLFTTAPDGFLRCA